MDVWQNTPQTTLCEVSGKDLLVQGNAGRQAHCLGKHVNLTSMPPFVMGIDTAGNSKTLSFKLAADRLRGSSSSSKLFRLFHAIDLFHYQCSEQSTSQVRLLSPVVSPVVAPMVIAQPAALRAAPYFTHTNMPSTPRAPDLTSSVLHHRREVTPTCCLSVGPAWSFLLSPSVSVVCKPLQADLACAFRL